MSTRIIYNGVEYASVEEMPPDVRFAYEQAMVRFADENRDGIPDVVQKGSTSEIRVESRTRYVVNGQEYGSLDEMPANIRQTIERLGDREGLAPPPSRVVRSGVAAKRTGCGGTILMAMGLASVVAAIMAV